MGMLTTVALGAVLASGVGAQAPASTPDSARIEMYPDGGSRENPVVLTFTGEVYEKGVPVPSTTEITSAKLPDEVKFLTRLLAADVTGTLDDILGFWDPPDREAIRRVASDPASFEGNRNFYRGVSASTVLAKMRYGQYEILFVKHDGRAPLVKDYPLVRRGGSLYLTNALQKDPLFVFVSTRYAQTLQQGNQVSR